MWLIVGGDGFWTKKSDPRVYCLGMLCSKILKYFTACNILFSLTVDLERDHRSCPWLFLMVPRLYNVKKEYNIVV